MLRVMRNLVEYRLPLIYFAERWMLAATTSGHSSSWLSSSETLAIMKTQQNGIANLIVPTVEMKASGISISLLMTSSLLIFLYGNPVLIL